MSPCTSFGAICMNVVVLASIAHASASLFLLLCKLLCFSFWRAFKTQKHNVCPVELAAQFEAFRALMGAQPAQTPEQAELSGTSVRAADASCLNAPVTSDELHDCIKRLKRKKSAGIDGILSEMVKDGGEVLHSCVF